MVARLSSAARALFPTAEGEARAAGSSVVEAEHLLLAMAAYPDTDAGIVLASVGLSRATIEEVLEREFEVSLAAAGVRVSGLGRPSPQPVRRLHLGTSFKAAMERSVTAAQGSPRIRPAHLLVGVLGAHVGTVPRLLRLAGVDRDELLRLTRGALAA